MELGYPLTAVTVSIGTTKSLAFKITTSFSLEARDTRSSRVVSPERPPLILPRESLMTVTIVLTPMTSCLYQLLDENLQITRRRVLGSKSLFFRIWKLYKR